VTGAWAGSGDIPVARPDDKRGVTNCYSIVARGQRAYALPACGQAPAVLSDRAAARAVQAWDLWQRTDAPSQGPRLPAATGEVAGEKGCQWEIPGTLGRHGNAHNAPCPATPCPRGCHELLHPWRGWSHTRGEGKTSHKLTRRSPPVPRAGEEGCLDNCRDIPHGLAHTRAGGRNGVEISTPAGIQRL
jgi:hypothetical protein